MPRKGKTMDYFEIALNHGFHRYLLNDVREDMLQKLEFAPAEAPALLAALEEGRVSGSFYNGTQCCFVGTLGKARHGELWESMCGGKIDLYPSDLAINNNGALPGIIANPSSPVEKWFMRINSHDTPLTCWASAFAAGVVREFLDACKMKVVAP